MHRRCWFLFMEWHGFYSHVDGVSLFCSKKVNNVQDEFGRAWYVYKLAE